MIKRVWIIVLSIIAILFIALSIFLFLGYINKDIKDIIEFILRKIHLIK